MQKQVEDTINLLLQAFSRHFDDFKGIYLYGLFSDGKNHKDEDIELVAIFDVENKLKREMIWPIVGRIETDLDVFIDLIPTTVEDLKQDEELWAAVKKRGIFYDARGQAQTVKSE